MKALLVSLVIIGIGGCYIPTGPHYTSVTFRYDPELPQPGEHSEFAEYMIAISEFHDERTLAYRELPKSKSYVTYHGWDLAFWAYGLTYENKEFRPVTQIVQDLLIKEFRQLGYRSIPFEYGVNYDYLLTGEVIDFRYYRETGLVSTRLVWSVSLELALFDDDGRELFNEQVVEQTDEKSHTIGVISVPENIRTLMSKTFRSVAGETMQTVGEAIAADAHF